MKKLLANFGLALVGLALGVALLEILCRLFPGLLPWPIAYNLNPPLRYHPQIEMAQVPNIVSEVYTPELTYTVQTRDLGCQGLGFRDDGVNHEFVILALGDSFTWGAGVDNDQVWTELLEQTWQVDVINGGHAAMGPTQERLLLELCGQTLKPEAVILALFVRNDFSDDLEWRQRHQERRQWLLPLRSWLYAHSRVYELFKYYILGKLFGVGCYTDFFKEPAPASYMEVTKPGLQVRLYLAPAYLQKDPPPALQQGWALTQEELLKVQALCEQLGSALLVIIVPDKAQTYWSYLAPYLSPLEDYDPYSPNSLVREFCEKNEIAVFDLTPIFQAHNDEQLYWPIDGHWNERGNQLAAEAIGHYLSNNGWLSRSGKVSFGHRALSSYTRNSPRE